MMTIEQKINQLGKYLYKNIDSAYEIDYGPQRVDIYFIVYYQYSVYSPDPKIKKTYSDTYEMHININLTCYSHKIRVNIIELSPDEMTLGQMILPEKKLDDLESGRELIESRIRKYINKYYEEYEFIY